MKKLKKMMALVLAVAMCLAMSMTTTVMSFADDEIKISMNIGASDKHEYKVYQIFTGDLSGDTLSNVKYGANYGETGKLVPKDVLDGITDADAFARSIAGSLVGDPVGTLKAGTTSVTVPATGYYMIVDDTSKDLDDGDSYSAYIVEVVKSVTVAPKKDTTTDDKKITTDTLGKDTGTNEINGKTDNVSVGDTVNYQITAKVPENASQFNYFYFVINDTLDDGLTFNNDITVSYKESADSTKTLTAGDDYIVRTKTTNPDSGEKTFQIGLNDAKSLAGKNIIVTYSAVLNENATIGETPNKNTSTVQYSNDPNHDYNGQNYPAFPGSDDDDAMGETPVTETKTYTTGIEIQKVDQDGNVLTGATFQLSGQSAKTVLTVQETFTKDNEKGNYYKLKNGTYTKTAPTTDGKYMVKTPGAAAGYVIDASYDGADKEVVDGVTYRPYAPATDEGKDVYVLHNGNGHLYDGSDKYTKSTTKTASTSTTAHTAEMTVDANGLARFDGLGAGTYTIKETGTPSGYNTMADMTVTVTFNANGTQKWSFSGGNGSYDAEEGIYKITIENQKGTELPSTGGMGTTIFYIAGAILVIGAVVLLIARKKAER